MCASAARSETGYSWPPANRCTSSTSRPPAPTSRSGVSSAAARRERPGVRKVRGPRSSRPSRRGNELVVLLVATLEDQEVEVAARAAIRVLPADPGPRFVDRAATLVGVEKTADCLVDPVLLV